MHSRRRRPEAKAGGEGRRRRSGRVRAFAEAPPADWSPAPGETVYVARRKGSPAWCRSIGRVQPALFGAVLVELTWCGRAKSYEFDPADVRPVESDGKGAT